MLRRCLISPFRLSRLPLTFRFSSQALGKEKSRFMMEIETVLQKGKFSEVRDQFRELIATEKNLQNLQFQYPNVLKTCMKYKIPPEEPIYKLLLQAVSDSNQEQIMKNKFLREPFIATLDVLQKYSYLFGNALNAETPTQSKYFSSQELSALSQEYKNELALALIKMLKYVEILLRNKVGMRILVKQIDLSIIIESLHEMDLIHLNLRKQVGNYLARKIELGLLSQIYRKDRDAVDRLLMRYLYIEILSRQKGKRKSTPITKHNVQHIVGILTSRLDNYTPNRFANLTQLLCEIRFDSEYHWREQIFPHFAQNYKSYSPKIINNFMWKFKDNACFYPGSSVWNAFTAVLASSYDQKEVKPWADEQSEDEAQNPQFFARKLNEFKSDTREYKHSFTLFLDNVASLQLANPSYFEEAAARFVQEFKWLHYLDLIQLYYIYSKSGMEGPYSQQLYTLIEQFVVHYNVNILQLPLLYTSYLYRDILSEERWIPIIDKIHDSEAIKKRGYEPCYYLYLGLYQLSIRGISTPKTEELMRDLRKQYENESLRLYEPFKFKYALAQKSENLGEILKYASNGALEAGFENERVKLSHPIEAFLVDLFIPELNLAIDFDKFHHYYGISSQPTGLHRLKSRVLRQIGVKLEVVRFSEIQTELNDLGQSVIPAVGRIIRENMN